MEAISIKKSEKIGECYKNDDSTHFYLVREKDVLHVTEGCINSLPHSAFKVIKSEIFTFIKTDRKEFNEHLNNVVFELDYFGSDYRNV